MPVQINTGHDIKGHKALQRPDLDIDLPLYPPLTSHQVDLINAHDEKIPFLLPIDQPDAAWGLTLDTREPTGKRLRYPPTPAGEHYELEERSLALFYLICPVNGKPARG
jgi:hypothetical protein